MLGTRGIWEDGWKAAAIHAPITAKGTSTRIVWQLYNVDKDRSESTDLAKQHPDKLKALINVWFEEADKNMSCRWTTELRWNSSRPAPVRNHRGIRTSTFRDGASAGNFRGEHTRPVVQDHRRRGDHRSGLLWRDPAQGSRFGGHTLFIKDRKLYYVYNFLGIRPEQKFISQELNPGKYALGMAFVRGRPANMASQIGKTRLLRRRQSCCGGADGRTDRPLYTRRRRHMCRLR